jgi:hypothetical protein
LRDAHRVLADSNVSRSVLPDPSKASSRHLRALHRLPRVVPPRQRRRPHEHHAVRVLLLRKVAQYPSTTLCVRTTPRTPQLGHHPPDRFSPARRRRRAAPPTARHRGAGHQLQRSRAGSARTPRSPPRTGLPRRGLPVRTWATTAPYEAQFSVQISARQRTKPHLNALRWHPPPEHVLSQQTGAGWRTVGREDSAVVTCCARVGRGGIIMVLVVVVPGKTLVP